MAEGPLVSIITAVLNGADTIQRTIDSVAEQDYPHIEYIVMDGGSTDGTIDILRKNDACLRWYSEPDLGQSDAINKGLARASGHYLTWIGDDDFFYSGAIRRLVEVFVDNPKVGLAYGQLALVDRVGKFLRIDPRIHSGSFEELLNYDNIVGQPQAMFSREAWKASGPLALDLHYCMDWDLWIKIAAKFPMIFIPEPLAAFAVYEGTKTVSGALPRFEEIIRMLKSHHSRISYHYFKIGYWHYESNNMVEARKYFFQALGRDPKPSIRRQLYSLILKTYLGANIVRFGRNMRRTLYSSKSFETQ